MQLRNYFHNPTWSSLDFAWSPSILWYIVSSYLWNSRNVYFRSFDVLSPNFCCKDFREK